MAAAAPQNVYGLFLIKIDSVPFYNNSILPYNVIQTETGIMIPLQAETICPIAKKTFLELRDRNAKHKLPYTLLCVQDEDTTVFCDGLAAVRRLTLDFSNPKTGKAAKKVHLFIQRSPHTPFHHLFSCEGQLCRKVHAAALAFSLDDSAEIDRAQKNFIHHCMKQGCFLEDVAALDEYILHKNQNDLNSLASLGAILQAGTPQIPKNFSRAETLLKRVLFFEPTNTHALGLLGQMYMTGGDGVPKNAKKAQQNLELAVQSDKDCIPPRLTLAELYISGGEGVEKTFPRARELLKQVLKNDPTPIQAYSLLINLRQAGGQGVDAIISQAKEALARISLFAPDNIPSRLATIWLFKQEGEDITNKIRADLLLEETSKMDLPAVKAFCEKEKIAFEARSIYTKFMIENWNTHTFDAEIVHLTKLILSQDPDDTLALTLLGELLRTGKTIPKDWPLACQLLSRCISLDKKNEMARVSLVKILRTGGNGVQQDVEQAKHLCWQILDLNSKNAEALASLAWMYYTGIPNSLSPSDLIAAHLFEQSLESDQNNLLALTEFGALLMHGGKGVAQNLPKAITFFERALKIETNHLPALLRLGILLKKGGNTVIADSARANFFLKTAYGIDASQTRSLCLNEGVELPPLSQEKSKMEIEEIV